MPRWLRAVKHLGRVGEVVRCTTQIRNWPGVVRRYVGLGGQFPATVVTRGGVCLDVTNHHDLVTAWVIFCRREYRVPADARLVVDLGANIGMFAIHAATTAPHATIVAFEPFPTTFDRLVNHVKANQLQERILCRREGVGAVAGVRRMAAEGPSQTRGMLPASGTQEFATTEVFVRTLPEVLDEVRTAVPGRPIDFLKIDVEGTEHEFLNDLPEGTLRDVQAIGMEYHPNGDKAPLFASLAAQGLTLVDDQSFGPNVGVAHFRRKS